MDESEVDRSPTRRSARALRRHIRSETADADMDDADTDSDDTDSDSDDTDADSDDTDSSARRRPRRAASSRSARASSSPSTGSAGRSSSSATSRGASTTSSRGRGRAARHLGRAALPGFRLVKAGEQIAVRDYTVTSLAPEQLHRDGRRRARARRVGARRDDRAPGLHLHRPAARRLLPRARAHARASGAGERVLHAALGAGPPSPPRHARRLRPAGRPARSAGSSTSPRSSCRCGTRSTRPSMGEPGRAGSRPRPPAGRHALPAAGLAPRGADLGLRLAPPHGRRQRRHLARRLQGGAGGVR